MTKQKRSLDELFKEIPKCIYCTQKIIYYDFNDNKVCKNKRPIAYSAVEDTNLSVLYDKKLHDYFYTVHIYSVSNSWVIDYTGLHDFKCSSMDISDALEQMLRKLKNEINF